MALRSGLSRQQVYTILVALSQRHIIHYIPGRKTPYITYTRERQNSDHIVLTREVYEDRKAAYEYRIKTILAYAAEDRYCRSRMLLNYFGEKNEHNCAICDVCIKLHKQKAKPEAFKQIVPAIYDILGKSPCTSEELIKQLNIEQAMLSDVLSYLLAEEKIILDNGLLSLSSIDSNR